jgi:hypothetical protein
VRVARVHSWGTPHDSPVAMGRCKAAAPPPRLPREQSERTWVTQHCYWNSSRDRFQEAGPLHVGTDAVVLQTSGDLQSYCILEPAWRLNGLGEVCVFSAIQVTVL